MWWVKGCAEPYPHLFETTSPIPNVKCSMWWHHIIHVHVHGFTPSSTNISRIWRSAVAVYSYAKNVPIAVHQGHAEFVYTSKSGKSMRSFVRNIHKNNGIFVTLRKTTDARLNVEMVRRVIQACLFKGIAPLLTEHSKGLHKYYNGREICILIQTYSKQSLGINRINKNWIHW